MNYLLIKSKKTLALVILMLLSLNVDAQTDGLEIKLPDGVFVVVNHPGELKSKIPEKMVQAIRRMKVKGELSNDDLGFLRTLAVRSSVRDTTGNRLDPFFDLDLSDAYIPLHGLLGRSDGSYIPDRFLSNCSLLRTIILPSNTIRVGVDAFSDCQNLVEVQMPSSVNNLCDRAFKGCRSLMDVEFSKSLRTIDGGCFEDCKKLQRVLLPDALETIGSTAFKNTAITKIHIPANVKHIGAEAFSGTAIEFIDIPDGMQDLDARAFEGCRNLKDISVSPQNRFFSKIGDVLVNKQKTVIVRVPVMTAGAYKIPEGITAIGNYAFSACDKITEVQCSKTLTKIGEGAFVNCSNMLKIELPATLQTIGRIAFQYSGLRSIDLPSVKELGEAVFFHCEHLSQVKLPMLEKIPTCMFEGCKSLVTIELPKNLKSVDPAAFKDCESLEAVEFPQTVQNIGKEAFNECKALKIVKLSPLLTFGDECFRDCKSLETFEFPQSVTTIGHKMLYGCKNLKTVTVFWPTPPKTKNLANTKATVLRVPSGSEDLYKKDKGWKKFKHIEGF